MPDFRVAVHFGSREKVQVTDWGYGYAPSRRYYGGGGVDVYTYTEGTLILDVVDATSEQLLWRGSATGAVSRSKTGLHWELPYLLPDSKIGMWCKMVFEITASKCPSSKDSDFASAWRISMRPDMPAASIFSAAMLSMVAAASIPVSLAPP